jgi:hypothetical protein
MKGTPAISVRIAGPHWEGLELSLTRLLIGDKTKLSLGQVLAFHSIAIHSFIGSFFFQLPSGYLT